MKKLLIAMSLLFVSNAIAITPEEIKNDPLITRAGKIEELRDLGSIYELVLNTPRGKQIAYVTKDGKYIIAGVLFDRKTGENLTAEREKEINKIDINKIPLKDALHIKFGKGGRKLILVADPECPYCRMAFNYLKNKNVDLYIFFMPLNFHKHAFEWSKEVLCSQNSSKALIDLESKGITPETCSEKNEKEAENKLKKHILTAQLLKVRATPTFITEEGYKIEGFRKKEIESYLGGKQ